MDVRLDTRALDDTLADPWVRARRDERDLVFPRGRSEGSKRGGRAARRRSGCWGATAARWPWWRAARSCA
jgi:hypothetical protein